MHCTCDVALTFGGPLDFLAAHPVFSLAFIVAAGWALAQVGAALRRAGR